MRRKLSCCLLLFVLTVCISIGLLFALSEQVEVIQDHYATPSQQFHQD